MTLIVSTMAAIDVTQRMFRWMFASRRAPRCRHCLVASSLATPIRRELDPVIISPDLRTSKTKGRVIRSPSRLALDAFGFGLFLLALDLSLRGLLRVQPSRFGGSDACEGIEGLRDHDETEPALVRCFEEVNRVLRIVPTRKDRVLVAKTS